MPSIGSWFTFFFHSDVFFCVQHSITRQRENSNSIDNRKWRLLQLHIKPGVIVCMPSVSKRETTLMRWAIMTNKINGKQQQQHKLMIAWKVATLQIIATQINRKKTRKIKRDLVQLFIAQLRSDYSVRGLKAKFK